MDAWHPERHQFFTLIHAPLNPYLFYFRFVLHFKTSFTRSSGRSTLNVFGVMLSWEVAERFDSRNSWNMNTCGFGLLHEIEVFFIIVEQLGYGVFAPASIFFFSNINQLPCWEPLHVSPDSRLLHMKKVYWWLSFPSRLQKCLVEAVLFCSYCNSIAW